MANQSVGAYYAKTHLGQLLDLVERGQTIEITRHGKAIACLVPAETVKSPSRAAEELIALRETLRPANRNTEGNQ